MGSDLYLLSVVDSHKGTSSMWVAQAIRDLLEPTFHRWGNGHLVEIKPAGSIAKGTAISGTSDVDILLSVNTTATETLKEVYETLYNRLDTEGLKPRKQNVSLGINYAGFKVDIVPAKKQSPWTNDHSLWSHKKQGRRSTNIHEHISYVVSSGRQNEIRLLKIWKKLHGLEFPSFLLEVIVIETLKSSPSSSLSINLFTILAYLRDTLLNDTVKDPTKPSNILSDELDSTEKQAIAFQAAVSLNGTFGQAVW